MSLINRLICLNLIELGKAIPMLSLDAREQTLDIALGEMQAALQEADEQVITLRTRHAQDETNLVGIMKNIQDLTKADATSGRDSQLAALREARSRSEEDLNGLELDEKQLRLEIARLMAKVNSAEVQRSSWLAADKTTETRSKETKSETNPPETASQPTPTTGAGGFGNKRVDEPFERLERLKRRLEANEISQQEATSQLEQELRDFELEKLFQSQEQEAQLEKELAALKKKLM